MTTEEAIRILDPETTGETLAKIEYYNGFSGKVACVQAVSDACVLAVAALREQKERRWIPVTERLPQEDVRVITLDKHGNVGIRALKRFVGEKNHLFRPDGLAPGKYITHWMPLPGPPKEETP